METRANTIVIGSFVLAIIAAAFGFVYWMKGVGGASSNFYMVLFDGSVSGLAPASRVHFNGIRVGKVQSVEIYPEDSRKVRVLLAVDRGVPVRVNSRARIIQQGFAGIPVVQISAGSPDAPLLIAKGGQSYPQIKADIGSSQALFDSAPEALGNANALMLRLSDLIANNEDSIRNTVKNIEALSGELVARKEDISTIIVNAKALSTKFAALAVKLEGAADKVTAFVGEDGDSVLEQAKQAAESFRNLAENLERSVGDEASGVMRVAKSSLQEFELFMRDGRRTARNLDRILEQIERNPQSFLFGGSALPEYTPNQ